MHYDQLFPCHAPAHQPGQFTYFRRLPAEIRNMIWEFALPDPRVYEVLDAPNAKHKTPADKGLMFANIHHEPPPALASVCRESRCLVLHHYKPLTLGNTTKYIDMSRDVLLLEPYLLVKRLHRTLHFMSQIPLIRENMTQLALGTSYGVYPGIFHPVLGRKVSKNNMTKLLMALARFPKLKTLVFVVHQEFQFEFDLRQVGGVPPIQVPEAYRPAAPPVGHVFAAPNGYMATADMPHHVQPTTGLPSPAHSTTLSPSPRRAFPHQHQNPLTPLTSPSHSPIQHPAVPALQTSPQQFPHQHPPQQTPQPQQQSQPKHQQIHQAYRFKFDIERNINSPAGPHGRRPYHTNSFLYYPFSVGNPDAEEDTDVWTMACRSGVAWGMGLGVGMGHGTLPAGLRGMSGPGAFAPGLGLGGLGLGGGMGVIGQGDGAGREEEEEEGEWCDPWPTNDDWRRFRRRWVRAMVAACLGDPVPQGVEEESEDAGAGKVQGKGCPLRKQGIGNQGAGGGKMGKERIYLPELLKMRIRGASLLWRYGSGVHHGAAR